MNAPVCYNPFDRLHYKLYSSLCIPIHKKSEKLSACVCAVCLRIHMLPIHPSIPTIYSTEIHKQAMPCWTYTQTYTHKYKHTCVHIHIHIHTIHGQKKIRYYNLKWANEKKYETIEADFNRTFLTRAIVNQNDQNSIFIKSPVTSIIQRQNSNKSR